MNSSPETQSSAISKNTGAFAIALAIAAVVNGLLVIAKEKSPAIMAGMKKLTGHHWITHSVIVIALFFVLGWILSRTNRGQGLKLSGCTVVRTLVAGALIGSFIIVGFYLVAD